MYAFSGPDILTVVTIYRIWIMSRVCYNHVALQALTQILTCTCSVLYCFSKPTVTFR